MPKNRQINFRVPATLLEEFKHAVAALRGVSAEEVDRKLGEPMQAAVLMFARASQATQKEWLRALDDLVRASEYPVDAQDGENLTPAEELEAAAQRAERARGGKKSKRRLG